MSDFSYGTKSRRLLDQSHPDLSKLMDAGIKGTWDITIVSAIRTPELQALLKAKGVSNTLNSKHIPPAGYDRSLALDFAPWYGEGIRWKDDSPFYMVAGWLQRVAWELGMSERFRWGADWDGDHRIKGDQNLHDPGHIEIVGAP